MYTILEFTLIEQVQPSYVVRTPQAREGFCNPRAVEVCATAEQAEARAEELNEESATGHFYKAAQILDTAGAVIDFAVYEAPPDTTVWYDAKKVCAAFGISRTHLFQMTFGAVQTRKGKEYAYEAVIKGGIKYNLSGRGKQIFYNEDAIATLCKHYNKDFEATVKILNQVSPRGE